MSTLNEKVLAAIIEVDSNSRALQLEVEYFLELQRENDEYTGDDIYLALRDADNLADDRDDRVIMRRSRHALILLGVYVEVTDEQLDRTEVSSGRKYDFKMGGKKYNFIAHLTATDTE